PHFSPPLSARNRIVPSILAALALRNRPVACHEHFRWGLIPECSCPRAHQSKSSRFFRLDHEKREIRRRPCQLRPNDRPPIPMEICQGPKRSQSYPLTSRKSSRSARDILHFRGRMACSPAGLLKHFPSPQPDSPSTPASRLTLQAAEPKAPYRRRDGRRPDREARPESRFPTGAYILGIRIARAAYDTAFAD